VRDVLLTEMKSTLLLDIVIRESTAILQLFASEDETLLIRWNTLLILNLRLHIVDSVGRLDFQRNGFAGQRLDEDLHASTEPKDEVKSRLLLDIVVGEGTTVLQLFAREDEALLIGRYTLLVLDLGFDVIDGIGRFDFEGDSLASERLDENLHAATETKNEMERGLFLDIVVRERPTVLKLFACEDEALLVWGDALLVLNFCLDVIDGIRGFDLEGDRLPRQRLDEDLHTATETKNCE
jgi:hypothetical protein